MPNDPKDYEVGFGKPPKHGQFQKGTSGNPAGRPKGSKGIQAILEETGREPVTISVNGKTRTVSKFHAASMQMHNKAASGDTRAFSVILAAHRQFPEVEEAVPESPFSNERDAATLKNFLKRMNGMGTSVNISSDQSTTSKETK
jgi:Family of unknown function (DUF5681)